MSRGLRSLRGKNAEGRSAGGGVPTLDIAKSVSTTSVGCVVTKITQVSLHTIALFGVEEETYKKWILESLTIAAAASWGGIERLPDETVYFHLAGEEEASTLRHRVGFRSNRKKGNRNCERNPLSSDRGVGDSPEPLIV